MSALLFVNEESLIGDSLSMYAAIRAARERWDGDAYIAAANKAVLDFVKPIGLKPMDAFPNGSSKAKVVRSSAMEAFRRHVHTLHMAQAHFDIMGLPVPASVPQVEVNVDDDAPEYDYVVSPWSRSDHDHNKAWFEDKWEDLFNIIGGGEFDKEQNRRTYYNVCVVGASDDPRPWLCSYEYGRPLSYVAGMMRKARKGVVTIDNGMAHVAHHAGITRHVLLYPACLPPQWVDAPNAIKVYGQPSAISVNDVLKALGKFPSA